MYLLRIRDIFENLFLIPIFIIPLFLIWFIFWLILRKKAEKESFYRKFHKGTGIFLIVAMLVPIVGYCVSQFSFGKQTNFPSYEYFVSTKPGMACDFADELPEAVFDVKYYCYHESLNIGKVVGVSMLFENTAAAESFYEKRMDVSDEEYSDREHIIYATDMNGLAYDEAGDENLRRYLEELSELPLEEYKVLLYYEYNKQEDQRWLLLSDDNREVIEIVKDYVTW